MDGEQVDIYGANLPILEKLKLLAEWAPLVGRFQAVLNASTPYDQAAAVVAVLQWAAGKSSTDLDDEALFHLEAVLKSPEGQAFFQWIVAKVRGAE
jgi:hypothetical protein